MVISTFSRPSKELKHQKNNLKFMTLCTTVGLACATLAFSAWVGFIVEWIKCYERHKTSSNTAKVGRAIYLALSLFAACMFNVFIHRTYWQIRSLLNQKWVACL